jgi:hypothetical protein
MKRTLRFVLVMTVLSLRGQNSALKIEHVMTAQELQQSGVSTLSSEQREALNRWLGDYTLRILSSAQAVNNNQLPFVLKQPQPDRTVLLQLNPRFLGSSQDGLVRQSSSSITGKYGSRLSTTTRIHTPTGLKSRFTRPHQGVA